MKKGLTNQTLNSLIYLYIGLPVLIFIIGWIKWWISIPVSLIILYSLYTAVRKNNTAALKLQKSDRKTLIATLVLICIWVVFSGIGGFLHQNSDHAYRNTIYKLLVNENWPVQREVLTEAGTQTRVLSYYIGFWLPSAIFGKIFGLTAGFVFQFFWAILGLSLIYLKLSQRLGRYSIFPLLIFILFSGLDAAGFLVTGKNLFSYGITFHLEWWLSFDYQFSSHTTMLFWVFNQAIYGWLLTLLILGEEDNRHSVVIWSCGLLTCTIPFVGMLPFLCYKIIINFKKEAKSTSPKKALMQLFSIENILGGGAIGIISFIYLRNNASAGRVSSSLGLTLAEFGNVALFLLIEAGIYYILVFKDHKKNPLYYISLAMLIVCPFVRINGGNDFCMRASMPSLLVLCLFVTESLFITWKKEKLRFAALLLAFLIGCITPAHEFIRTIKDTRESGTQMVFVDEKNVFSEPNFSSNTEDNLFVKYLAK